MFGFGTGIGIEIAESSAIFLKIDPAKPTAWSQNRPLLTILFPENRPHSNITDRIQYIKPRKPTAFTKRQSVIGRSVIQIRMAYCHKPDRLITDRT